MKFRRIFEIFFPMYYSFPFHILGQPRYSLLRRRRRRRHAGGGGRSPESPFRKSGNEGKKVRDFPQKSWSFLWDLCKGNTNLWYQSKGKKVFFLVSWLAIVNSHPNQNPSLLLLRTSIREICGKQKLLLFCLSSGEEVKVPLSYLVSFQRLSFRCVNVRTVSMYSCLVSWLCFKIWAGLSVRERMKGNARQLYAQFGFHSTFVWGCLLCY